MSSTFGKLFTLSTWGESHGGSVGVVVDGCPAGLPLCEADVQKELDRRKPGQSKITTQRAESDTVSFFSGVYQGKALGTPIAMNVVNQDQRPGAYDEMRDKFRPSHADYSYQMKYGLRAVEGGGRSSARETIGRVAAGAIARKILTLATPIRIVAYVESIHGIRMPELSCAPDAEAVEANAVRCPDAGYAQQMYDFIDAVRKDGDSVGGVIRCHVSGCPAGLGEPIFDRIEADLGKAMLSIPAAKGFTVGSGFEGTLLKGSEHNDLFEVRDGKIRTKSNYAGGTLGGITSGEELTFRIAFKPTATILKEQSTVDLNGNPVSVVGKGRHDPCVLPRAVPIVEAMTSLVLVDHWMRQHAQNCCFEFPQ